MVEANGTACSSVTKLPRMAVFQCDSLHPNTSYNITAVDGDGHVDSLHCSTANHMETISELKLLIEQIFICTCDFIAIISYQFPRKRLLQT